MKVLGLIGLGKSPGACLMEGAQLIACAEEERFLREKVAIGRWPINALRYCLEAGGSALDDIDRVAIAWNCEKYPDRMGEFFRSLDDAYPRKGEDFRATERDILSRYTPRNYLGSLNRELQIARLGSLSDVAYYDHHHCHAAQAFYSSGFGEALVLVMDGSGEEEATTIWEARHDQLRKIKGFNIPHSLGRVYSTITEYLGFRAYSDEGKVMGLAPYGKLDPEIHEKLSCVLKIEPDGEYVVDPNFIYYGAHSFSARFTDDLVDLLGPPRRPKRRNEPIAEVYKDIAYSLQLLLEQAAEGLVRRYMTETGLRNVCVAGGVAMNCKMNGVIGSWEDVEELFVHPASHDGGACIGAAMMAVQEVQSDVAFEPLDHAYYGPKYSNEEIEELLGYAKLPYQKFDKVSSVVAEALEQGEVVALFQGRMEMGARALGNRSILANPLLPDTKKLLNDHVKHREYWRPFCPSVLAEYGEDFFESMKHPHYMLVADRVRSEKADLIPSAVHVDGTARPQFVSQETNPVFWSIIEEFRQLTGVPVIINTSFNVMGEPIINTPQEAIKCFYSTGIDMLVLENCVLKKSP